MAVLQCKMCGGSLIPVDATVCECDSCGTRQTIPNAGDDKKTNLFNRANRLRMNSEFDKAGTIYEQIAAEYPQEAEAYWGLCLCNYGIEYVDDPATGAKMPTCHRTLTASIMEDSNFEQACDYADTIARKVYRDEAKTIDRIQKDILSIAANEAPYDVFICYKETAEDGGRTEDSVLAQDIYDALTAKGLKVFFSRITLEDKLGVQYEPYIFAALSSAKVMLAIGTAFEYYDAVWVKNEWSRFLSMMKTDKTKTLIPCFKGLDAYDMPKEFKGLQAQDMGKLGWMQDLVRGVEKLCGKGAEATSVQQTVIQQIVQAGSNAENLMKRVYLFLEDGDTKQAEEYICKVLDENAVYAPAYVARVLIRNHLKKESELPNLRKSIDEDADWKKALRFANDEQRKAYAGYAERIRNNESLDRQATAKAMKEAEDAKHQHQIDTYAKAEVYLAEGKRYEAAITFGSITEYQDAKQRSIELWKTLAIPDLIRIYGPEKIMGCSETGRVFATAEKTAEASRNWSNAVQVCGQAALLSDGSVVAERDYKVCGATNIEMWAFADTQRWQNVKSIYGDGFSLVALHTDGKVSFAGYKGTELKSKKRCYADIDALDNIESLEFVEHHGAIGITTDGKIKISGAFRETCKNTETWKNIKMAKANYDCIVAVTDDGHVLMDGKCEKKREIVEKWIDIESVSCDFNHICAIDKNAHMYCLEKYGNRMEVKTAENVVQAVGMEGEGLVVLHLNGTVEMVTHSNTLQIKNELQNWNSIVAVYARDRRIIGLTSDGHVVDRNRMEEVRTWKLFEDVNTVQSNIEARIIKGKEEARKRIEEKKRAFEKEKHDLVERLAGLKGLFQGGQRKAVQMQIDKIDAELRNL